MAAEQEAVSVIQHTCVRKVEEPCFDPLNVRQQGQPFGQNCCSQIVSGCTGQTDNLECSNQLPVLQVPLQPDSAHGLMRWSAAIVALSLIDILQ